MYFSVVEKKYHQVKERKKGKSLEILDLVKEVRLSLKKKMFMFKPFITPPFLCDALEVRRIYIVSLAHHLLAMTLWTSYLRFLGPCFSICKMRKPVLVSQDC